MRSFWVVMLLAGCPGSPKGHLPVAPAVVVQPTLAPTPWWAIGDAACPPMQGVFPGASPGATVQARHLVQQPGDVHCEVAGLPHGPATRMHPSGRPAETGIVISGIRQGTWTELWDNGNVASHGAYANGMKNGIWATFYASGRPRERGEYINDKKFGVWLEFDDATDTEPDRFVEYKGPDETAIDNGFAMRGGFVRGEPRQMLPVCVIGMAYPLCRVLPIADLEARWQRDQTATGSSKVTSGTFRLGALYNYDAHHGFGASFGWVFDNVYPAYIVDARYRFWLYDWIALEGSVGSTIARGHSAGGMQVGGALVLGDVVSVTATAERHSNGDGDVMFGVRFGIPTLLVLAAIGGHGK